jgi:hypothetical protein
MGKQCDTCQFYSGATGPGTTPSGPEQSKPNAFSSEENDCELMNDNQSVLETEGPRPLSLGNRLLAGWKCGHDLELGCGLWAR